MKRSDWDTSYPCVVKRSSLEKPDANTCLVVRDTELLAATDELPHCFDKDCDGARAHKHFGVQFDVQLTQ